MRRTRRWSHFCRASELWRPSCKKKLLAGPVRQGEVMPEGFRVLTYRPALVDEFVPQQVNVSSDLGSQAFSSSGTSCAGSVWQPRFPEPLRQQRRV